MTSHTETLAGSSPDYPAVYWAADSESGKSQRRLLCVNRVALGLLLVGALCATIGVGGQTDAIVGAALFLASLAFLWYDQVASPKAEWYSARALAESVKTLTWRFVMRAEPFASPEDQQNLIVFQTRLRDLLQQNKEIGSLLGGDVAAKDQVTDWMRQTLAAKFEHKRSVYLTERIGEQRGWYGRKSGLNRKWNARSFAFMAAMYGIAVLLFMVRIASPDASFLPIEVVAVAAAGTATWRQLKRYDELARAYGLTAHEVGIIQSQFDSVRDEESLAAFVSDAENAFSREHTQWAARRDH